MAAPTSTVDNNANCYTLVVSGSNVSAGNNDYPLGYFSHGIQKGFSIVTGTLTNMTVTILAYNVDSTKAVDVTSDITGSSSLASSTGYACDVSLAYQNFIIRAARSNATNAVYFEVFTPKR